MADDKKRFSASWITAAIAAIVFVSGLIMTVRAEDLSTIYSTQKDHEVRIRALETQEATLIQKMDDFISAVKTEQHRP